MPNTTQLVAAASCATPVPPGSPPWITPELLAKTIATWQPYYSEPLSVEDATEILSSFGLLIDAMKNKNHEEVSGVSPTVESRTGA